MQIIDADGHITEGAYIDEIAKYMPGDTGRAIFPALDHFHSYYIRERSAAFGSPDAAERVEFMDDVGIDWSVVYPTSGLSVGRIVSVDWAIAACAPTTTGCTSAS